MGLLLSLMLTSCGLYNKYERPDVNTQGLVRDIQNDGDTLALNSDENFGNLPWREVFTDPQLQGLIEQALENNVDLRNAALNVKMMETALTVSKLAFLPSVAFAPQGTISQVQMDGASVSRTYQLPISATWNLDLFGNLLSQKRSAQMKLLATKDYQTDRAAQKMCEMISRNYDERAITEAAPVTVSFDGVVMCGNLRTMAGMLAAYRNTDGAYIDYLRNHCSDYGFKVEDIDRYHHPRLLFMTKRTAKHRYSKEEFEKFASL